MLYPSWLKKFANLVSPRHSPNKSRRKGANLRFEILEDRTCPAPVVTKVLPATGPVAGGTTVTITGTGFGAFAGADGVLFGLTKAKIVTATPTQLVVTDPAHVAGLVDVTVSFKGLTSPISANDHFTYTGVVSGPNVTSVTPNTGSVGGGTTVTIKGTGFSAIAASNTVKFGATTVLAANIVSATTTQLVVKNPAHIAGIVDVTVAVAGKTSAISAGDKFTYGTVVSTPVVTSVSPNSGPLAGGTTVTIKGTGFSATAASNTVKFGATTVLAANIVSATATQLVVKDPAHIAGLVDVTVAVAGKTSPISAADNFTYTSGPIVASVSPNTGPVAGGTTVTITGTGFSAIAASNTVKFGATTVLAANIVSATTTQLVVKAPAGVAGTVDVTVTVALKTSTISAADKFTYTAVVVAPVVSGVSPNTGPTAGGTTVTITGTGFSATAALNTVSFDGNTVPVANIVSATTTQLVVKAPGHAAGTVDVTVAVGGATSATGAADKFTYVAPVPISFILKFLPNYTAGQFYSQGIPVSGGLGPITFSISAGSLPAGMGLDKTTGNINGTSLFVGQTSFTVTAKDGFGDTTSQGYTLIGQNADAIRVS